MTKEAAKALEQIRRTQLKRYERKEPKKQKYNAEKLVINGNEFDSKKEYTRYFELSLMQKNGLISELQRQVKFVLIPTQREILSEVYTRGKHKGTNKIGRLLEKECAYYADFVYLDKNGNKVVEDTKGCKKGIAYQLYVIKRKLMLQLHGIKILEI